MHDAGKALICANFDEEMRMICDFDQEALYLATDVVFENRPATLGAEPHMIESLQADASLEAEGFNPQR